MRAANIRSLSYLCANVYILMASLRSFFKVQDQYKTVSHYYSKFFHEYALGKKNTDSEYKLMSVKTTWIGSNKQTNTISRGMNL